MSFGPTFGSFGDFVTLVSLVKELIKALDDSRGSAKDYRDVVSTLRIQIVAINQIGELYGAVPGDERERVMQSNADQILQQIRQCIDEFLNKLSGFAPSLANSGSRRRPFDFLKKIKWNIERKEIDVFEKRVAAYNDVLHMYIGLKISDTLESTRDKISTRLLQSANASDSAHAAQSKSLHEIQACIIVVGRAILAKLGELADACNDIRSSVTLVLHSGLLLLPLLQTFLVKLTQLAPSLEDTYFVLTDHLGGRKKIFLGNILSWDMFYDLLALSYKSERGARRIGKRRFTLEQNMTNQEIDTRTPWKSAFRPCQVVQLSLLCRRAGSANNTNQCPGCGYDCAEAGGPSTTCKNCQLRYTTRQETAEKLQLTIPTGVTPSAPKVSMDLRDASDREDDSDEEDLTGLTSVKLLIALLQPQNARRRPWEKHKAVITRLYIDEGKRLDDVMEIMRQQFSFVASKRAYRFHFDHWGVEKYNPRSRRQRRVSTYHRDHFPSLE